MRDPPTRTAVHKADAASLNLLMPFAAALLSSEVFFALSFSTQRASPSIPHSASARAPPSWCPKAVATLLDVALQLSHILDSIPIPATSADILGICSAVHYVAKEGVVVGRLRNQGGARGPL